MRASPEQSERAPSPPHGRQATPERLNVFYRLSVTAVVALIVTVLAMVAGLWGNPAAPVNAFLAAQGGVLIAWEVFFSLLFGLSALAVDRRRTAERRKKTGDPEGKECGRISGGES